MSDIRFPPQRFVRARTRDIGFRIRGVPPPHRRSWLIRPDDLLVFDVERVNLRIVPGGGDKAATLEREKPGNAYLIVTLPPQNFGEIAYFKVAEQYQEKLPPEIPDEDEPLDAPPIRAIIASWSRLVFIVPDPAPLIRWTSQGVLDAIRGLELSVALNAPPPQPPTRVLDPMIEASINPLVVASGQLFAAAAQSGHGGPSLELQSAVAKAIDIVASGASLGIAAEARVGPRSVLMAARARRKQRLASFLGLPEPSGASVGAAVVSSLIDPGLVSVRDLFRPRPMEPGPMQTAIEMPWRLIISPSRNGAWFHQPDVAKSEGTGRTELWHTRLGSRQFGDVVPNDPQRVVRAIWALSPPGEMQITMPPPPTAEELANNTPPVVPLPFYADEPFRTSLTEYDRHNVVHLSSNFQLHKPTSFKGNFEPSPVAVQHLALSSLGGWLDSRGLWSNQPRGLDVMEWRHLATLGRDHFVRVVYAGRLFPIRHRACLVKITERCFEPTEPGNPAYLRQQMLVVPLERVLTYRQTGWKYEGGDEAERIGERWDLKLPFKTIRIVTPASPFLDVPDNSRVHSAIPAMQAFWPYVGGQPFCFDIVATDAEDQPVDLAMPLIFVAQSQLDLDYASKVPERTASSYRTRTWPNTTTLLATVPAGGQRIAFADADKPDDTTFATRSLTFDVEIPKEDTYDKLHFRDARFLPVIRTMQLDVPPLQKIAQTNASATLTYDTTYLHNGFETPANAGQVFLARDKDAPALGVAFSSRSERSGGLVAPDLSLSGLSRISGPVSGDIATAAGGTMDPTKWFADVLDGAKLFGVLKLADILAPVGFGDLDKLPRLVGGFMDQVQRLVADLERLQALVDGMAVAQLANIKSLLDQLTNPSTGSIAALQSGGGTGPVFTALGALDDALEALPASLGAGRLTAGPQAVLKEAAQSLRTAIAALAAAPELLEAFAEGDFLPEQLSARFEWRPVVKAWPTSNSIFKPRAPADPRNLLLSVEASGEDLVVTCSLDTFDIDLEVLVLEFERVQFRARAGAKPEIDVSFSRFKFAGPLAFIETLREIIPIDGFSDPPEVKVTAEGISAGFSMGLPNIAFGVFSLENLSLAAGFTVPFVGPPMSTWFRFCERENPSRLTVMMFGGGFFFGITVNADGLQVAEGAIEFGAAISVNFGVASGSVSAMAGLYFKLESDELTLAGYFRLRGEVEVLGVITVSIELYLEMRYETGSGKCVGTATISIEVDVALFSATVEITCTKKFAGSGADPTLAEMFDVTPAATSADWNAYCGAFA